MSAKTEKYLDGYINVKKDVKVLGQHVDTVFHINSLQQLIKWQEMIVQDEIHNKENLSKRSSMTIDYDKSWYGTENIKEWFQVSKQGDIAVMKEITEAKKKALKKLETKQSNTSSYDVEGLFFDIGKVMSGHPECWIKPDENEQLADITIKINTATGGGTSAHKIAINVGKVLGMVTKLEQLGHRVKVENWIYNLRSTSARKKQLNTLTVMTVKDFTDAINFAKMSALVSPSLQRRGMFMLREIFYGKSCSSSMGGAGTFNSDVYDIDDDYRIQDLENLLFTEEV